MSGINGLRTIAKGRMTKIFISYRRDDSPEITGRIYDRLTARFSAADVFRDIDNIPAGVDFRKVLDAAISGCDIVLAIVGPRWTSATDKTGARRIDNVNDFVRIELESALRREIRVIPILVSNASMPTEQELPATLSDFAFRNCCVVRPDPDFHRDVDLLIERIGGGTTGKQPIAAIPAGEGLLDPASLATRADPVAHRTGAVSQPVAGSRAASSRIRTAVVAGGTLAVLTMAAWMGMTQFEKSSDIGKSPDSPQPAESNAPKTVESNVQEPVEVNLKPIGTQRQPMGRIDLLPEIDLKRDVIRGGWSLENGKLLNLEGARRGAIRSSIIALPWNPPREYRLWLKVTRKSRETGSFNLGLSSGDHRVLVLLDMQRNEKEAPRSSFRLVDGGPLTVPSAPSGGRVFPRGSTVPIRCTVRTTGIRVETGDRVVIEWQGKPGSLQRMDESPRAPLFLAINGDNAFMIEEVWLQPLGNDRGAPYHDDTSTGGL
jgi:TIR domain